MNGCFQNPNTNNITFTSSSLPNHQKDKVALLDEIHGNTQGGNLTIQRASFTHSWLWPTLWRSGGCFRMPPSYHTGWGFVTDIQPRPLILKAWSHRHPLRYTQLEAHPRTSPAPRVPGQSATKGNAQFGKKKNVFHIRKLCRLGAGAYRGCCLWSDFPQGECQGHPENQCLNPAFTEAHRIRLVADSEKAKITMDVRDDLVQTCKLVSPQLESLCQCLVCPKEYF